MNVGIGGETPALRFHRGVRKYKPRTPSKGGLL